MLRRRRLSVAVGAGAIVTILVIATWPAAGATTNTAHLDGGDCIRNLQIGSDPNASSSATPSFILVGDGSVSSYEMLIDGESIGTFNGDTYGRVCITTSTALAQGPHQLTGRELKPNTANPVTPYAFSVDTIPPPAPSKPTLDPTTDSAPQGDNVTTFTSLRLTGTAPAGAPVRLMEGSLLRAGATANSTGQWLATTPSLPQGSHTFFAISPDSAGNVSAPSPSVTVTIGTSVPSTTTVATTTTRPLTTTTTPKPTTTTTAPRPTTTTTAPKPTTTTTTTMPRTAPSAPTNLAVQSGHKSGVTLTWNPPTNNGGAQITYYAVYRSTASGAESGYALLGPTTSYTDPNPSRHTTYYYRVAAGNDIGTGPMSAEAFVSLR